MTSMTGIRKYRAIAAVGAIVVVAAGVPLLQSASAVPSVTASVPSAPSDITVTLGPSALNEPFQCWTDGAFGVHFIGGTLVAPQGVAESACEQFMWTGDDVDHLVPETKMTGLTYNTHTDRGRIYDELGWWPSNIYVDDSTNPDTWYSYIHTEDGMTCDTHVPAPGSDLRTVGVWASTDEGASWTYDGVGLSLDAATTFNAPDNDCHSQTGWPKIGGPGDNTLIVGQDGYLYQLYTQFTYDNPDGMPLGVSNVNQNLAIARSSSEDAGAAGTWQKYYNGAWSEPGQGGHESYIMSEYTTSYPGNGQRTVAWSTYLEKYVMIFNGGRGLFVSYSDDLLVWTQPQFLYQEIGSNTHFGDDSNFISYVNLVGIGDGADGVTGEIGRSAWMYYVVGTQAYEVHRRLISFDDQENLAFDAEVIAQDDYGTGAAANLTDGDIQTIYRPNTPTGNAYGNTGDLVVDLGSTETFNQVKLWPYTRWGYGFPNDFTLAGSSSSTGPWTTFETVNGLIPSTGATQVVGVGTQNYRYVRLAWNRVSGNQEDALPFSFILSEIGIFNDTQGAPPQPVPATASSGTHLASSEFSSTQGDDLWTYMYKSPLDFPVPTYAHWSPMTYDSGSGSWRGPGPYASISAGSQHPGFETTPGYSVATARVWRAPADGVVHITGNVAQEDAGDGNGVLVRIMLNRTTIWPVGGGWEEIAYDDLAGVNIDLLQQVSAADRLLFVVDSNGSDVQSDNIEWDPQIEYSPEDSVNASTAGFSSTQGANDWSYKYYDGSTYSNLTWNGTDEWVRTGTNTVVGVDYQHPDAGSASVRVWTAPASGIASVTGFASKADVRGGDGTWLWVSLDSAPAWPAAGGWAVLDADDAIGFPTNFSIPVTAGQKLYFVVYQNADASYDATLWPVTVQLQ